MYALRKRGLGQAAFNPSSPVNPGTPSSCGNQSTMPMTQANIDLCSGAMYYLFPPCWACSKDAWNEAETLNVANITATQNYTPTGANLTPEQLAGQAPISPDVQAAAGVALTQQQVLENVQNQPELPEPTTCSETIIPTVCDWTVYLVGGGVVLLLLFIARR